MTIEIGAYDYDDQLLEQVRVERRSRVRVYRLERTVVVLGRGSKPEQELQLDACLADQVVILRRRGGGCSVVIDPGNVVVSAVLPSRGVGDSGRDIRALCDWLGAGLGELGAAGVVRQGISDLAQGASKVGGSCIYRARDLLYFSATLLVSAELGLIDRYLRHPPREPAYRRQRSHRGFLSQLTLGAITPEGLCRSLPAALSEPPSVS